MCFWQVVICLPFCFTWVFPWETILFETLSDTFLAGIWTMVHHVITLDLTPMVQKVLYLYTKTTTPKLFHYIELVPKMPKEKRHNFHWWKSTHNHKQQQNTHISTLSRKHSPQTPNKIHWNYMPKEAWKRVDFESIELAKLYLGDFSRGDPYDNHSKY